VVDLALSTDNSSANLLMPEDAGAHEWYSFVLSYPPHLVRHYLTRFGIDGSNRVLDPFCGIGTTVVESKKNGIPSVGIEANPMAWFASTVKTDWRPEPGALLADASSIAATVTEALRAEGLEDVPLLFPNSTPPLRTLPAESDRLLLKNSISPLPLHKALTLLDAIDNTSVPEHRAHYRLAFAKALVDSASNLSFGPEVGVSAVKPDAPIVGPWLRGVRRMADDLRDLGPYGIAPAEVHLADSRHASEVLEPNSIDAVITSPPYPNEKDYTRTTRLESVLLGFIRNRADLQEVKRGLLRSNTRGVYKGDDDDQWVEAFPEILRIAHAIEDRRKELGKTSGFERLYARVTMLYFGGMARHLTELRRALKPGARLAYVVGDQASYLRIMIRTGELLASIAESVGYEVTGIDLFRTRLATATRQQLREEVVVLRWPG